jgi:hypothetical protein
MSFLVNFESLANLPGSLLSRHGRTHALGFGGLLLRGRAIVGLVQTNLDSTQIGHIGGIGGAYILLLAIGWDHDLDRLESFCDVRLVNGRILGRRAEKSE